MAFEVVATETFLEEYDSIIRYHIESLSAPNAAKRFVTELDKAQLELADNPMLHAVSRKGRLMNLELRERVIRNYVIVYKIAGEKVFLEHLYHQSQDFESLVAEHNES